MTDAAPLERLQKIADYRTTCKYLSKVGMEGIVFGCIILLLGGNTFEDRILDYFYMGLGVAELVVGIRNRFRPSASGVVLQGMLLMMFGIWNLGLQAIIIQNGGQLGWFGTIFGVLLIIIGITQIRRY